MFETILLPIDTDQPASWEKALPMAVRLAGKSGTIHVLGIVHDLGSAMVASFLPEDFEAKAIAGMQTDLEAFIAKNIPKGTKASALVAHGQVPEQVLETATSVGADLIVMASHPPSELRSWLIGSYAENVVRHSQTPVLVVR